MIFIRLDWKIRFWSISFYARIGFDVNLRVVSICMSVDRGEHNLNDPIKPSSPIQVQLISIDFNILSDQNQAYNLRKFYYTIDLILKEIIYTNLKPIISPSSLICFIKSFICICFL